MRFKKYFWVGARALSAIALVYLSYHIFQERPPIRETPAAIAPAASTTPHVEKPLSPPTKGVQTLTPTPQTSPTLPTRPSSLNISPSYSTPPVTSPPVAPIATTAPSSSPTPSSSPPTGSPPLPSAERTAPTPEGVREVRVTLGEQKHIWDPLLGGVIWISSKASAKKQAEALSYYSGDVLLALKHQANGFGYRFDLDFFEPNTVEYGYYQWNGTGEQTPVNLDDQFQIFGKPNSKFILHVPIPNEKLELGRERFSWQTPEFYAAQLQYLFGTADAPEKYQSLPPSMDFFAVSPDFNWANLRARRGHREPYRAEAVMLGEEPYHIEGWSAGDGAGFGAAAERYRAAMRSRGVTLPYGLHVSQLPATNRSWFNPMLDALSPADPPNYLDLYHHYSFASGSGDWLRSFPVSKSEEGFTDWWPTHDPWQADYTRFLWTIEDTRKALEKRGISPQSMRLGFSEHGIAISSPFKWNDMTGALHWALWLAESMRYDTDFDSMWVLLGEGFSTAQVQLRGGVLTKTPAFFAYEMAKKFEGLRYRETDAVFPSGATKTPEGKTVGFPWLIVRAFDRPDGSIELFVVNQHPSQTYRLTGFPGRGIESWEVLSGESYASQNPLGESSLLVETKTPSLVPSAPLDIPPISISRIVLK